MKYVLTIFLLFILTSLFVNFNLFDSYLLQTDLITEINSKTLKRSTLDKLDNLNTRLPNVTMTALPLAPIHASYKLAFGEPLEAIDKLNDSVADNDYIGYREAMKSQVYYELKVLDSSLFYAKKAYLKIPQNPFHFERLVIAYAYKNQSDSIVKYFNLFKHEDIAIWKLFLSSFLANDSLKKTDDVFLLANKAKKKFPNSQDIAVFSNAINYGLENVKLASELATQGEAAYNESDFKSAAELFVEASRKNPGVYTNFENAASCYLELKDYEKALEYSSIVLDSFNIKLGKSEFLKALSLSNLGDKKQACTYIKLSIKRDFKNAYPYLNKYCK